MINRDGLCHYSSCFLSFTVGEIMVIADNQINKAIFYVLYLPECSLALDIH